MHAKPRIKLMLLYGIALASGATLLDWLEFQFLLKRHSTEIYVVLLCGLFTGLGLWIGHRLTRQPPGGPSGINKKALAALGISGREADVLALLAAGHSNQEIADRLFISLNTVKTHLNRLYQKMEVSRRVQAVEKARSLRLVP